MLKVLVLTILAWWCVNPSFAQSPSVGSVTPQRGCFCATEAVIDHIGRTFAFDGENAMREVRDVYVSNTTCRWLSIRDVRTVARHRSYMRLPYIATVIQGQVEREGQTVTFYFLIFDHLT